MSGKDNKDNVVNLPQSRGSSGQLNIQVQRDEAMCSVHSGWEICATTSDRRR